MCIRDSSGIVLSVERRPFFEDNITHYEYHPRAPYASASRYGNNDEVRIPILQQEVFTLPMESFLYVEVKLSKKTASTGTVNVKMVNNAIAILFEEIRYELAGVEVDRTKSVGITSTIKTCLLYTSRCV